MADVPLVFPLPSTGDGALKAEIVAWLVAVGDRIDQVRDGALYGVSGSLGGRTPVGPFIISLGWVDNGNLQLQLAIGRPIAEGSILDELR